MEIWDNARNPLLPLQYHIPDVEAHVMPDGKAYLYGSWDQHDDNRTYCGRQYRVFSTRDMQHWTDHGISFDVQEAPWLWEKVSDSAIYGTWEQNDLSPSQKRLGSLLEQEYGTTEKEELAGRMPKSDAQLYAPDAICKDGRYYLYFCASDNSEGVAVSDKPEGPFLAPVRLPCEGIDPAVFVDDDGKAYYYWGQFRANGVQLADNMIEFKWETLHRRILTEEEHGMIEGCSMRKRNDIYYLIYACLNENGNAMRLAYATSHSPLGDFVKKGTIIENLGCDPGCVNNHGSIEEINGQWYVFYHRSSRNSFLHRRVCAEPICFREDGTIPEVKMTSQGAGEPFSPGERIMGYQACELSGTLYIDAVETEGRITEKLTRISPGDKAVFRYVGNEQCYSKISVTASGSGNITIMFGHHKVGWAEMIDGKQVDGELQAREGEYEVTLRFDSSENLELLSFVLE